MRPHALTGTSAGGSFSYNNAAYMTSRRDRTGAVTWTYTWRLNHKLGQTSKLLYRPWGETRVSTGTTPTTWRFTGQREDATIGLYFYNARYLDPQLGRFISPDTIVPEPGNPQSHPRIGHECTNGHVRIRVFVHHSWTATPTPSCRSRAIRRR